jgi:hypothetical protein
VFKKLGIWLSKEDIDGVCAAAPGKIENILRAIQLKVEEKKARKEAEHRASLENNSNG